MRINIHSSQIVFIQTESVCESLLLYTYLVTKFPQLIVNKTCNIANITVNFGMVFPDLILRRYVRCEQSMLVPLDMKI
jgi:hypothetical protein